MCVVFIVEDEPGVRVTAERILKRAGHAVLTASSVGEAFAVIDSDQDFDLLFTDMTLGDRAQGGMEVAQRLATRRPGLRVLGTSGGAITTDAQKVFTEPNRFLPKPYSMAGLLDAIADVAPRQPAVTIPALPLPQPGSTMAVR